MGGMGFGNFDSGAETKNVDIGDAHISVEIDGGKASGSMSDIEAGTFVTITMNGKARLPMCWFPRNPASAVDVDRQTDFGDIIIISRTKAEF